VCATFQSIARLIGGQQLDPEQGHNVRFSASEVCGTTMRVLVTGGSGFIASHCIAALIRDGHDVVFTVRSTKKGAAVLDAFQGLSAKQLSFVIVQDMAAPGAFDDAVRSDPPFEAVLHTASPFHFDITDVKKDMLDPAVEGTLGILKSVKHNAPEIRRVVITSSFAAMSRDTDHPAKYDESHWSSITLDQALHGEPFTSYRASKQFAERAAWAFMDQEQPNFTLTTLTPPAVFGPMLEPLSSLDSINTSNQTISALVQGQLKAGISPSPVVLWVDVRDLADAHVRALEREAAAGKRIFVVAGLYRNAEIVDALRKHLPQLRASLPEDYEALPKEFPFGYDNSRSTNDLSIRYRSLEESVTDTAQVILRLSS
jgi:nucleoside-diphosphate-sugar epimerase